MSSLCGIASHKLVFLMLCAALEHICRCQVEKERREKQMEALKSRIEELNGAIALCQEKLPASGAPVARQVSHSLCH